MSGHIFFVCGHSNWGKSKTLGWLTGSKDKKWVPIAGANFWVRKMSNDDRPGDYLDKMGSLDPESDRWVVAALCPAFGKPDTDPADLLHSLRQRGYDLHFWVIEQQYCGPGRVPAEEISRLQALGDVEVFPARAEAEDRERALRAFIERRVEANARPTSAKP